MISLLERNDWNTVVKKGINDFLMKYGNCPDKRQYAVFDFDNTTTIFDSCENTLIYQLENMIFAFTPDNIREILSTDLSGLDKDLTFLGLGKGSYNDWLDDIETAYIHLYNLYGPFGKTEVSREVMQKIKEDDYWLEFAVKIRVLYDLIGANESTDVSYPWIIYVFSGFTPDDIYDIAFRACRYYEKKDTGYIKWQSPECIKSKVGVVKFETETGISVTENIKELWKCLDENGIDVWVCSASEINLVRGAIDALGLHNSITGLMGMTAKVKNGICINEYNYTDSLPLMKDGNGWKQGSLFVNAQTQGKGKVTAINNVCGKIYGTGPVCCFGDSTGDFCFCTEYESIKLVCCFNRANRKVTDGGSLLAELSVYENDYLGYDFEKADNNGDIYFVLQGRDDNKSRTFRNSDKTVLYAQTTEILFKENKSDIMLKCFKNNCLSVKEICEKFCIKTNASDGLFDFDYGFMNEYEGYRALK